MISGIKVMPPVFIFFSGSRARLTVESTRRPKTPGYPSREHSFIVESIRISPVVYQSPVFRRLHRGIARMSGLIRLTDREGKTKEFHGERQTTASWIRVSCRAR